MNLTRLAVLLLAFVALSALAADETKQDKDKRECQAEAAKADAKHPASIKKVQGDAYKKCMRGRGWSSGPIREK